jgi:UrcA family protein
MDGEYANAACHMGARSIGSERLDRRQTALAAALLMALLGVVPVRALAHHRAATATVSHVAAVPRTDLNPSRPQGARIARTRSEARGQGICGGLTRPQAPAGDGDQIRSRVVRYGDLDLAVTDGASTLYQRLKVAAREVCKTPDGGYGDPAVGLHCYHDALRAPFATWATTRSPLCTTVSTRRGSPPRPPS